MIKFKNTSMEVLTSSSTVKVPALIYTISKVYSRFKIINRVKVTITLVLATLFHEVQLFATVQCLQ